MWTLSPNGTDTSTATTSFTVDVTMMDLEDGFDYLEVYDLDFNWVTGYTGDGTPTFTTPPVNGLIIALFSDGDISGAGFDLNWSAVDDSVDNSTAATPYCSGVTWQSGMDSGSIADGSGDDYYANGSNCTWIVEPNSDASYQATFTIDFSELDLELNYDTLKVYSYPEMELMYTFTGNTVPATFTTIQVVHGLQFVFMTDDTVPDPGFALTWSVAAVSYAEGSGSGDPEAACDSVVSFSSMADSFSSTNGSVSGLFSLVCL